MQVAKWGNSLAVRLPKKLVEELGLKAGDVLKVVKTGANSFEAAKPDKKAEFLERMKAFNIPLPPGYKFNREEANARGRDLDEVEGAASGRSLDDSASFWTRTSSFTPIPSIIDGIGRSRSSQVAA
jgi:antitoxin MazE